MLKRFFSSRKLNIIYSAISIILMWVVWIIAYYCVKNDYVIPSFQDTFAALFKCFTEGAFWVAASFSLLRTLEAFLISFVIAVALAVFSALSKAFEAILKPVIALLRTLPTLAVILILLVWTNASVAPVIVTVLVLLPLIYARINAQLNGIDRGLTEMADVYKIKAKDRIFKIYLPLVSPNILSQTGADISLGLKVIISAEVLSNTYKSLGGLMQNSRAFLEMPRLAALTLVAVAMGLIIDLAVSQLARLTYKWSGK
ncbi:MAG: ABC transporter permease subunit [Clostridia bacterium]|nr:ABC transporter permease subunit [Clostridia bacterium]